MTPFLGGTIFFFRKGMLMILIMSANLREMLARRENFALDKSGIDGTKINIDEIKDSDELISKLLVTNSLANNEARDKAAIARYLRLRSMGINGMHHYLPPLNPNMNVNKAVKYGDEGGIIISGREKKYLSEELRTRGKFDYRITMRGSSEMVTGEALAFTDTLVAEANKRNLTIRMKDPWTHDAVILYVDKEDLLGTVKMLEDLKNTNKYGKLVSDATKHFGDSIAFGAVIGDNNYYGISMAHSELEYGRGPSKLMGYYGGGFGNTFGSYMESECVDKTYDYLLNKYNGDVSKITIDEMYDGIVRRHHKYMMGSYDTDLPLWMNRRNYQEAKKIDYNKVVGKRPTGFYIPDDYDLDDNIKRR